MTSLRDNPLETENLVCNLGSFSLMELLMEIERRGIRITEQGYYPTIGTDMAIGARNLLDMLPMSLLNDKETR